MFSASIPRSVAGDHQQRLQSDLGAAQVPAAPGGEDSETKARFLGGKMGNLWEIYGHIPSGKHTKNYGKIHHFTAG